MKIIQLKRAKMEVTPFGGLLLVHDFIRNIGKETKIGFGLEYLPFSSFRGNAVWFATGLLSYNVAIAMKNLVLPEVYRDKEIETIRYWIYSIPAWTVEHGRKVYWALSCDKRQFKEIKGIRNRCLAFGF